MWFSSLIRNAKQSGRGQRRRTPTVPRQRSTFRPQLEALDDRILPSTYYAATASDLIADINAVNTAGGANTIVLTAPTTSPYVLTAVNNTTDGPTVLPVIAFKKQDHVTPNTLTILTGNGTSNPGYGDIIDASRVGRLFDVASACSLTLKNVTLQNGLEGGLAGKYPVPPQGGAIFNQGTLVLSHVLVQNNAAVGQYGWGQDAAGGGIWSNGSLTVENSSVFQANSATGSDDYAYSNNGGNAFGGAIYIAGGTANITGSFFGAYDQYYNRGNLAEGGQGRWPYRDGSGYGGAIYIAGGTVTLNADTIGNSPGISGASSNIAQAPSLSESGYGYGGGLYVAGGTVTLTNDIMQYNVAGGYYGGPVAWGGGYGSFGYANELFIASGATVYVDSFTQAYLNGGTVGMYILLP